MIPDSLAAYLDLQGVKYDSTLKLLTHVAKYIMDVYNVPCVKDYRFDLSVKNRLTHSRASKRNSISKYKTLDHFLKSIDLKSYFADGREYIFFVDRNSDSFHIDIGFITTNE